MKKLIISVGALYILFGVVGFASATPFLLSATGFDGDDLLTLTFSEPVYSTSGGSGLFDIFDFTYTDGNSGGATGFQSAVDADGSDSMISFRMDSNFVVSDNADTINPDAGEVYALDGSTAPTTPVSFNGDGQTNGNGSTTPVPEPATVLLIGTGLAGLIGMRRKLRK